LNNILNNHTVIPEIDQNHLRPKQEELVQVELRSDEVMDVLGNLPHWSIHSGSGYLLILIFLSFLTTWFIKYPDVLVAPVIITTETPPLSVMAGGSGYLNLWVKDMDTVKKDQYLGYISNTSDVHAVLNLKDKLDSFSLLFASNASFLNNYTLEKTNGLGELQEVYNVFIRNIYEYQLAQQQKGFQQQIKALTQQISSYHSLARQTEDKNAIMGEELQLSSKQFSADSVLFANSVLSRSDFEEKKRAYLQVRRNYKTACLDITNQEIQITQLQGKVSELTQLEQKQNENSLVAIEAGLKQLQQHVKSWIESYMLKAPVSGKAGLFRYWSDHQFVKSGEEVLSVVPGKGHFFGMAKAPLSGSGKIKTGQNVNIKLDNYPSAEYGLLSGRVENISLLPRENTYLIRIHLVNGLQTSYRKNIEGHQEMSGQAEIVTRDMRLLERFFYQIRKLVNE
jgi:HlyD family secretion protein